jgi:hypothetical protein
MKQLFFLSLFTLSLVGATSLAEMRIQRVAKIGPMNNPVIFQSRDLRPVRATNLYKGKLIARWGVNTFEVGVGTYSCKKSADLSVCKLQSYVAKATYESCTVQRGKAVCRGRLQPSGSPSEDQNSFSARDLVDGTEDSRRGDQYDTDRDVDYDSIDRIVTIF